MSRDVTVRLAAEVASYVQSMGSARDATLDTAAAVEELEVSLNGLGSSTQAAATQAASSLDTTTQAAERAADGVSQVDESAQQSASGLDSLGTSAEGVSQGLDSTRDSTEGATSGFEALNAASEAANSGVSASSEALFRMTGGLSGVASEADIAAMSVTKVGTGVDGLATSFAEGLDLSMGFVDGMAQVALSTIGISEGAREIKTEWRSAATSMSSDMTRVGTSLGVVGGGLTAIYGSLLNLGIQYNTLQQVAGRAMETMTGSVTAAADQMERLHAFADESPFARQTWIVAQQQLMAFGMEAERVVPSLEGIQNAVAAIGGGDAEIMQLVDILGTVEGQGRMTGRELQRLGQMGINAAELIGDAMGVSGNEIREQITAGALDAETAITALTEGMNERFSGAAEGLRDTMDGAIDRIKAAWRDLASIMAEPLVSPESGGALVSLVNTGADLLRMVQQLPDPLIQATGALAGLAGAGMLGYGALLVLVPQIVAFRAANAQLAGAMPTTYRWMGRLTTAASVATVAFAGLQVLDAVTDYFRDAAREAPALEQALDRMAASGVDASNIFTDLSYTQDFNFGMDQLTFDLNNMSTAMDHLNKKWYEWGGLLQRFNGDHKTAQEEWRNLDAAMQSMVSGGAADQASEQMAQIAQHAVDSGKSLGEMADFMPGYVQALEDLTTQTGVSVSNSELLEWAFLGIEPAAVTAEGGIAGLNHMIRGTVPEMEEAIAQSSALAEATQMIGEAASDATSGLTDMINDLRTLGLIERDATQALGDYHAQLRRINDDLEEYGGNLDVTTEKGQRNYENLSQLADAGIYLAETNLTAGDSIESVAETLQGTYEQIREFTGEMTNSSDAADRLANELMGIDPDIDLSVDADALMMAQLMAEGLGDGLDGLEGIRTLSIEVITEQAEAALESFETGDYKAVMNILADPELARQVVWDFENDRYTATADIDGNVDPAARMMAAFLNDDHETVAQIIGEDENARNTMHSFLNNGWETSADIGADDRSARSTMMGFTGFPWHTTVDADARTAYAEAQLNWAARDRTSTITVTEIVNRQRSSSGARSNMPGYARGGQFRGDLPGYAGGRMSGTKLPRTGLGTDRILGLSTHTGGPAAWLNDEEWIINQNSSRKYNNLLDAINRQDNRSIAAMIRMIPGYAGGGLHSARSNPVSSRSHSGFDYGQLAEAVSSSGGGLTLNMQVHNPRGIPTEQSVKEGLEVGSGFGNSFGGFMQ